MKKIKKAAQALKNIAGKPALLNLVLEEDAHHKRELNKKFPEMESLSQIKFSDLPQPFDGEVETFLLEGSSLPTDLALLKTLAQGRNSYFEIGTWRGESVWNVAKNIEDCTTFNLPKDEINQLGLPAKYAELHGFLSKRNPSIQHLTGNSKSFDFRSLGKKFDLIFIDGDHSYDMVKNDTAKVFESLIHENSVVVWHDYAHSPENIRYEVFRGILDGVPSKMHSQLFHVQNTLCAVFLRGEYQVSKFESPKTPEQLFTVKISVKEQW